MRKPAATVSLALHVLAAILLFTMTFPHAVPQIFTNPVHLFAPPPHYIAKNEGGGGQRQSLPARRGEAPRVVAHTFVPPMVTPAEAPKLVVIAALSETPETNIHSPQIGDPLGSLGLPSGGPGINGIGGPGHDGIGPTSGPRQGGFRPVVMVRSKLSRDPVLIYKEEPEFSDEARKAHYEGTVVIDMVVDAAGQPTDMHVVRGLGMGLDEKALAAVAHWKFKPALSGNQPVAAMARIQVTFHLL